MDDRTVWSLYFGQIAGMRFHPRNLEDSCWDEDALSELRFAAQVADQMVRIYKERFYGPRSNRSCG
jgi:hypothetical protein